MLRFALPALAGLLLSAAGAFADETAKPAPADLGELKDAVAAARKRGDNVDAVAAALSALEKALAKGAAKPPGPDAAPPELAALRGAVEAAMRKGENLDAISKELARVEKALTGKEFERPKAPDPVVEPEPVPQPVPPFRPGMRRPGGFGRPDFGNRIVIGGAGGNFKMTAITISNGNFTIRATRDDVSYTITGEVAAPNAVKITVRDGEKKVEAEDVKKLPQKYRPAVEELLKMVRK
jgi:hypothetical protein